MMYWGRKVERGLYHNHILYNYQRRVHFYSLYLERHFQNLYLSLTSFLQDFMGFLSWVKTPYLTCHLQISDPSEIVPSNNEDKHVIYQNLQNDDKVTLTRSLSPSKTIVSKAGLSSVHHPDVHSCHAVTRNPHHPNFYCKPLRNAQ